MGNLQPQMAKYCFAALFACIINSLLCLVAASFSLNVIFLHFPDVERSFLISVTSLLTFKGVLLSGLYCFDVRFEMSFN